MNNRLYRPSYDQIDLEVFIGPRTLTHDDAFETEEQPVFVNYDRVGKLETGWDSDLEELRKDAQRIRTKQAPEGEEGPALSNQFFQRFGAKLFRILFSEGSKLDRVYRERLTIAQERDGVLRLNMCFDPLELPTELALAPWEYMYDPVEELFLAASEGIAFSRRVPTTAYVEPFAVTKPLRLLVAISNPSDLQSIHPKLSPLNVKQEEETVDAALKDCEHIEVKFVGAVDGAPFWPSRRNLEKCLEEFKPNIFHFIGHGVWRDDRQQLVITTDDNLTDHIDADRFRTLLRPHRDELKVVYLAACQSGEIQFEHEEKDDADWSDPWAGPVYDVSVVGIAPKLLKLGIPAVLAMQHSVSMTTARDFASSFYEALAAENEDAIDAAVNRARQRLQGEKPDLRDFGTPVLYTLLPRLFKLDIPTTLA